MRVNELIYRLGDDELVHIRDISRKEELTGLKKDIVTNELFKKRRLGDLLVTSICTRVDTNSSVLKPVICIIVEK